MGVLPEPMAEDNECLGSQVEEARRDRWTSVGHVKVQGHSGRYGAFTVMHVCTCSGLTPKDDFVRYLSRKKQFPGTRRTSPGTRILPALCEAKNYEVLR